MKYSLLVKLCTREGEHRDAQEHLGEVEQASAASKCAGWQSTTGHRAMMQRRPMEAPMVAWNCSAPLLNRTTHAGFPAAGLCQHARQPAAGVVLLEPGGRAQREGLAHKGSRLQQQVATLTPCGIAMQFYCKKTEAG